MRRMGATIAAAVVVTGCMWIAPYPDLNDDAPGSAADAGAERTEASTSSACVSGSRASCFTGPTSARGKGTCRDGTAVCLPDGGLGACVGQVLPAIERCDSELDEDCDDNPKCSGPPGFLVGMGDEREQYLDALAMAPGGAVIAVGNFAGELRVPPPHAPLVQRGAPGLVDGFVLALDSATGATRWAVSSPDVPWTGIAASSTAIAVIGTSQAATQLDGCGTFAHGGNGDPVVALLGLDGRCVSARSFQGLEFQRGLGIAIDGASGDILIAGQTGGPLPFGGAVGLLAAPPGSGFVVRLDSTLAAKSAVLLRPRTPGEGQVINVGVAAGPAGKSAIVGSFRGAVVVEPSGIELVTSSVIDSYIVTMNGNAVTSATPAIATGKNAIGQASFDPNGTLVVTGSFEGAMRILGQTVTSAGQHDGFVARFDVGATLTDLGIARLGSAGLEQPSALAIDSLGQIVVAGTYGGTAHVGGNLFPVAPSGVNGFVAKYSLAGSSLTHHWSHPLEGTGGVASTSVAVDAQGNAFVGGLFSGAMTVGPLTANARGSEDAFVARFGP
jgi:hypothetical protein